LKCISAGFRHASISHQAAFAVLTDFAEAARDIDVDTLHGGWLSLSKGVSFLGRPCLGGQMLVREAYVKLFDTLEADAQKGFVDAVISGNPGVGKSWFGIYALIRSESVPAKGIWVRGACLHCSTRQDAAIYVCFSVDPCFMFVSPPQYLKMLCDQFVYVLLQAAARGEASDLAFEKS
jgi:hypothetical protein